MSEHSAAVSRGNSAFMERLSELPFRAARFISVNRSYFLAFLLPTVILFIAYIIFGVWPFGERSVLSLDLNAQYVYYYDYIYDVLAGDESIFYSWSRNLSGEFAGIIGYYLASPFNLLVYLWDRSWITEGLLTMMLAKAGACGLSAAFLLKRHRGLSDTTTVCFSVMYALCGFFVVQTMDPMWLDGLVALPLAAMGVERICDKRRFKLYVLSLVYIFIANFYIGYMVGIFTALYFFYYLASGKSANKCFGQHCGAVLMYGTASVSAILMSCVMILPVYKSLSNGKFEFTQPDFSVAESFDIADTFIKLFPCTYDSVRMEGMPALYAGTLALVFTVIYFISRRFPARERIAGGVLVAVLMLCMYIRPVDMLWHGGQMPNWLPYRYSFLVSFLLILFGAEAFDRIKKLRGASFGTAFGILLAMLLYADLGNDGEFYDAVLDIAVPLAVLGVICIAAYAYKKYCNAAAMKVTMTVLICAECLLNTTVSLFLMHRDIVFSKRATYRFDIPYTREVTDYVHQQDGDFYRMEKTFHRCVNDPIALRMYGMSHSSSTLNARAIDLLKGLGFSGREHYSRYDGATLFLDDIFGVRYVLAKDERTVPYTEQLAVPRNDARRVMVPGGEAALPDQIDVYKNSDELGIAYLASDGVLELVPELYTEDDADFASPFRYQNALAKALSGDEENTIFLPVTDVEFDSENIRTGYTTDSHHSYRKKDEEDGAWISYTITAQQDGPIYMFLPTIYERETGMYINGEYRQNYYKYENYSAEYLGTYKEGESFELKLELLENAVYFKEAQFFSIDMQALQKFNDELSAMNAETTLTRTSGSRLELSVNAAEDMVLFTTIPAEEGWTVLVDGREVPWTTTLDGALLAVPVAAGEHEIVLDFVPAGLKAGLMLTGSGILLFVIMILAARTMRRKEPADEAATEQTDQTE